MNSVRGVAGRTRSRQGFAVKQYFKINDNKRRKQPEVELISSEEEWDSGHTVSDHEDDEISIKEAKLEEDNEKALSVRIQPRQVLNGREAKIASREECSSSDTTGSSDDEASPHDDSDGDGGDSEQDLTGRGSRSSGDNDKSRGIASRTRSHFRASRLKNTKAGTFSNPISLEDEDEQEQKEKEKKNETRMSLDEDLTSSSSDDEDESPKVTRKRRRKLFDGFKTPVSEQEDSEQLAITASGDETGIPEDINSFLSSVSSFGTKAPQPLEQSESEDETDRLWAELDDCLLHGEEDAYDEDTSHHKEILFTTPQPLEQSQSEDETDWLWAELDDYLLHCEEDTYEENSHQVENGHYNDPNPEDEISIAARCRRGDHEPAMNEEIGLVCIHCRHIVRDVKDCDPEFGKHPSGRSRGRYSHRLGDSDDSFSDDSEHENSWIDGDNDKSSRFFTYASTGTVWDIIPRAKKKMYSHQREAFEFLWTNLAGGIVLDKLRKQLDFASGGGSVISHAPGTGKTFLTIAFIKAFMRRYPNCRPMILAPSNILHTWERELKKWQVGDSVSFHNLNKPDFSGEETQSAMSHYLVWKRSRKSNKRRIPILDIIRWVKVCSWRETTSILGISYTLFDRLTRRDGSEDMKKALKVLSGLVILDEGHTPRNARSCLWKALSNLKTKRRIILSGTPFQNNFTELNNTLRLAKPDVTKGVLENLLRSYDKVESQGERDEAIARIKDVLKPFVHVHEGTVLEEKLPGLKESVVSLRPSQTQMFIFECIQKLRDLQRGCSNWFKFEHLMSVASVHPSLFVKELTQLPESERVQLNAKLATLDWSPEAGVKTKFVLDLIKQSECMEEKEKVLIFSQYIDPLKYLAEQINSRFHWREGQQMIMIHGQTLERTRQASIDAFNNPNSKARVMLASIKSCYEGINLVGASRVILLDTLWNPSAERQAVSRAYRIGQRKIVYTYRLITAGTCDEQKLCIQDEKNELSELVFSVAALRLNMSPIGFEDKLVEKMEHKFGRKFTKKGVAILVESKE